MGSDRQLYVALCAAFFATRVFFYAIGVRYGVSYAWQHYHDVDLLKDRLWESLLYSHAFPPAMNLLSGIVLKISEPYSHAIYHALFAALGLSCGLSMAYLMRVLQLGRRLTLGVVLLFVCTPAFIYFENLLLYEFPTAVLLTISAVLLHLALTTDKRVWWFAFFFDCTLIAYTRLTFHLVWVVAMVVLALLFAPRSARRILATAAIPVLLVVALYVKNQVLFGFFGATSRSGFSLALMTTRELTKAQRIALVKQGKLHPVSIYSVYSGIDRYAKYVDITHPTGIPVLDRINKADGQPNFNHFGLIEVARLLMRDDRAYALEHRWNYVNTVLAGPREYLSPTTRWHPKDISRTQTPPDGSPHRENRAVIGAWEEIYNATLHGLPPKPYGLYALLVPLVALGAWLAFWSLWKNRLIGCEREKIVAFLALNSAYVPAVSFLATHGELARYRFIVEAFMWIVGCWTVRQLVSRRPAI